MVVVQVVNQHQLKMVEQVFKLILQVLINGMQQVVVVVQYLLFMVLEVMELEVMDIKQILH
ncbi:MAG: hypothetical protein EBV77_06645 [Gemmatimonadaceae bacterium]|nr:hypothetical protein [Gemmatimonadaceae bacterium]